MQNIATKVIINVHHSGKKSCKTQRVTCNDLKPTPPSLPQIPSLNVFQTRQPYLSDDVSLCQTDVLRSCPRDTS